MPSDAAQEIELAVSRLELVTRLLQRHDPGEDRSTQLRFVGNLVPPVMASRFYRPGQLADQHAALVADQLRSMCP